MRHLLLTGGPTVGSHAFGEAAAWRHGAVWKRATLFAQILNRAENLFKRPLTRRHLGFGTGDSNDAMGRVARRQTWRLLLGTTLVPRPRRHIRRPGEPPDIENKGVPGDSAYLYVRDLEFRSAILCTDVK